MSGNLTPNSIVISAGPSQTIVPSGNPTSTLTSLGVKGTTQSSTSREYLVAISFTSNRGSGAGTPNGDKVALYTDNVIQSGSGDGWAMNPLVTMAANSGTYNAQIIECDLNNNNAHRGDASGSSGLAAPVAYGVTITGAGNFRSTSGILIGGPGTPIWNRGLTIASGSVSQSSFQDLTNSTTSIDIQGSHRFGVDCSGGSFTYALRLGNGQGIAWNNAANTAVEAELQLNNGNNLVVNLAGLGGILCGSIVAPINDNAYPLGQGSARWTSVWAANGTIQTSDPTLKTEMSPLPGMTDLVKAVTPISFKWTSGGFSAVMVDEEREVQSVHVADVEETVIELRNGKPTQVVRTSRKEIPIFDDINVTDIDGSQVFVTVPEQAAVVDDIGIVSGASQAASSVPLTHRVARMTRALVPTKRMVEHAGKRTHCGFSAPNVKAAFDKLGLDFGGYVKASDGTECLRPDQLIAPLWKAVQELIGRIEELEKERQV